MGIPDQQSTSSKALSRHLARATPRGYESNNQAGSMESPPASSDYDDEYFDASKPLRGVVVCCTSIPANERTDLGNKVAELGGLHEYDLTPKTTHLVVGEYDTTKYRHVAKSRPDIKAMAVGWVDALRNLWVRDDPIDFPALEKDWTLKTFETGGGAFDQAGQMSPTGKLLCCISGIEEDARRDIINMIKANGGNYTGNLDKTVTHLIVREPTGRKYMAARSWGTRIIAPQWVKDSIRRGMILDEACYDPHLPPEDIGKGAWVKRDIRRKSLGKRLREAATAQNESGRRKLRKTASMKLSSQRENMWGQILGQQPSANQSGVSLQAEEPTQPLPSDSILRAQSVSASRVPEVLDSFVGTGNSDTVFASCCFYIYGFPAQHVEAMLPHITSREGTVVVSLQELFVSETTSRRFVIVPQNSESKSHPLVPEGVEIITEFFIEQCIHRKSSALPDPKEQVLGRPFPVFPIEDFAKLSISTSGFVDLELNQVEKAVRQLGACYAERFTPECSMLLCTSLGAARKQKVDLALMWGVPVIKADWLWGCISQGKRLSTKEFHFAELKSRAIDRARLSRPLERSKSVPEMSKKLTPKSLPARSGATARTSLPGPDLTAFDTTSLVATEPPRLVSRGKASTDNEPNTALVFETALTHQPSQKAASQQTTPRPGSRSGSRPLVEKSANDLNMASLKDQPPSQPSRETLARVRSEVADSEAGEDDSPYLPGDDYAAPAPGDTKAEGPAELEKSRLEREKAAERRALSSKLTSLLEGTIAPLGGTSFETAASNVGMDDSSRFAVPPPPAAAPRRKRKIIGRVVSNASAVSTGSAGEESSAGMVRTHSTVFHEDDLPGEEEPAAAGPTATQLEYDDPEATRSKARLMRKMLGGSSLVTDNKVEDKPGITVGSVYRAQEALNGRSAGGRSMRRR